MFVSTLGGLKEDLCCGKISDVMIVDSTLREGEQAPGVAFTIEEALKIVDYDFKVGVDLVEVFAPYSEYELQLLRELKRRDLSSNILVWCRLRREDLDLALNEEPRWIAVSIGVSDIHLEYKFRGLRREDVLAMLSEAVDYLHSHGVKVSVHLEDSTRTRIEHIAEVFKGVNADKFRDCDTLSVLLPPTAYERMCALKGLTDKPIETHYHNDFGMAVGNTVSAVMAGAEWVSATWNGIGERAGNAALEELLLTLKVRLGVERFNLKPLREACRFVAHASQNPLSRNKPVSGSEIFNVESGIHQDGLLKDRRVYEPYPPELLGETWRLVIGDSSGKAGLIHVLNHELGYKLPDNAREIWEILSWIRRRAREEKRYLSRGELEEVAKRFSLEKFPHK